MNESLVKSHRKDGTRDSIRAVEDGSAGTRLECPDRRPWRKATGLVLVLVVFGLSGSVVQAQERRRPESGERLRPGMWLGLSAREAGLCQEYFDTGVNRGCRAVGVLFCERFCEGCGCVQNNEGYWWRKHVVGGKAVWDACTWNPQCAASGAWPSVGQRRGEYRISAIGGSSSGGSSSGDSSGDVPARLSQAERLPGEYSLSGSQGDVSYSGTLSIRQAGPAYALDWTIAGETHLGIGLLQGNRLTTVIGDDANCTVTAYQRDVTGRLDGVWVAAGIADTGSEIAFPDSATGSSLAESYYVRGVNTDGTPYEGPLRVRSEDGALSFDWNTYQGVGIQRDSQITVIATSDPEAECMVGMYEIASDGSLHGIWGWANARQVLLDGTEVATPLERAGSAGGAFTVSYERTANADFHRAGELFNASQALESVAQGFSESLVLPHDVPVFVTECGEANAYYDPNNQRILLCYDLLAEFVNGAIKLELPEEERDDFVVGAGSAFLIHEMGHALVRILDLPITGREEDAVDDLAATTLLGQGESGIEAAYSFAGFWGLWGDEVGGTQWGEHSLPLQRMYRTYCLIYGSDMQNHEHLLETLPSDRAARCPSEYERISSSWARILDPHRRSSL